MWVCGKYALSVLNWEKFFRILEYRKTITSNVNAAVLNVVLTTVSTIFTNISYFGLVQWLIWASNLYFPTRRAFIYGIRSFHLKFAFIINDVCMETILVLLSLHLAMWSQLPWRLTGCRGCKGLTGRIGDHTDIFIYIENTGTEHHSVTLQVTLRTTLR